jgi:FKBP-type peptidyl-prolyl cis-trans isomerase FkpA
LNGQVFDTNTAGTYQAQLGSASMIAGWQTLTKFRKGAKVRLIIPSTRAYANTVRDNIIWENTPLDFDIEIVDVAN